MDDEQSTAEQLREVVKTTQVYCVLFLNHLHFGCSRNDTYMRKVRVSFVDGRVRRLTRQEWDRYVDAYGVLKSDPTAVREEL